MPEVNGIELTTIIRDHQEFAAIPIVFLSGEQNADKQLDALSVGGDDFVAKPIRPGISWESCRRGSGGRATAQCNRASRSAIAVTGLFTSALSRPCRQTDRRCRR